MTATVTTRAVTARTVMTGRHDGPPWRGLMTTRMTRAHDGRPRQDRDDGAATTRGTGRSRRVAARRRTGNPAVWSGYARTTQATAQVVDEEVVMRADSRHGSSHPDRSRDRA